MYNSNDNSETDYCILVSENAVPGGSGVISAPVPGAAVY